MTVKSIPTTGRTLDMAASVYDLLEPLLLLGKEKEMNALLLSLLDIKPDHKILDIGCGTGVFTSLISEKLDQDGYSIGIDAAGKMIEAARKKRGSSKCKFEAMAAEKLHFDDQLFNSAVSTLFYHHVDRGLKQKSLNEAYRVLKPGGKLIIADMHIPTTFIGSLVAHASRWILVQPQIGENIRGILPELIVNAGFSKPEKVQDYLGYISVFSSAKPE